VKMLAVPPTVSASASSGYCADRAAAGHRAFTVSRLGQTARRPLAGARRILVRIFGSTGGCLYRRSLRAR
jgi:hypothetical protein